MRSLSLLSEIEADLNLRNGGDISQITVDDKKVIVTGWAQWEGLNPEQGMKVVISENIINAKLEYSVNGRGNEYLVSSFNLTLELDKPWLDSPNDIPLCLNSVDPKLGSHLLQFKNTLKQCNSLKKQSKEK